MLGVKEGEGNCLRGRLSWVRVGLWLQAWLLRSSKGKINRRQGRGSGMMISDKIFSGENDALLSLHSTQDSLVPNLV